MRDNEYGHLMDEPYQCIHCYLIRTQASQNQTMMNVKKYMVIQLKIFNYDQESKGFSKTVPHLVMEDKIHNINMFLGDISTSSYSSSYLLLSFSRSL